MINKEELNIQQFRDDDEMAYGFLDFFFNFKPYKYQKEFITNCIKYNRIAAKWPRQSGKSQSLAAYAAFRCLVSPTVILILAPNLTQATELYSKIKNLISTNEAVAKQLTKSTETELRIKLVNGESRIKAIPVGQDGKSARGYTADIVILEESGVLKDSIVNQVAVPILASKGVDGQLIKIGTPLVKNHFHRSCFIDPEFKTTFITWRDCVAEGQYSEAFIEEQRRNITDIEFRTEYEAEFIEENSAFFSSKLIEECSLDYVLMQVI